MPELLNSKFLLFSLLLTSILLPCSCSKQKKQTGKKSKKVFITKTKSTKLTLKSLKKKFPSTDWDLYIPGKLLIPGPDDLYRVSVYLNRKNPPKSILTVTKRFLSENEEIIADYTTVNGIADEMNIVKLASDKKFHLILFTWHASVRGFVMTHTGFFDFTSGKLKKVWSIINAYDPELKNTYSPPEFHYWDGDDDGIREVILTNPWSDKKHPPKWKFRWSVFRWIEKKRVFIPVKGLMLSKYKDQHPVWLAFAFAEAVKYRNNQIILETLQSKTGCDNPNALLKLVGLKKWKSFSKPTIISRKENQVVLSVNFKSDTEYSFHIHANKINNIYYPVWKICNVKLYKIKSEQTESPENLK